MFSLIKSKILVLILSLVFFSCKKDAPTPIVQLPLTTGQNCENFPENSNSFGVLTYSPDGAIHFKKPYFNPNNIDEFIYVFQNLDNQESKLMKFNIKTKLKTELVSSVSIVSQPKWSNNGWIAFDSENYQIWKVKDNGDSLTQITSSIYNLFPVWSENGNELLWEYSPVLGIPYFVLRKNLISNVIDTLYSNPFGNSDISTDNLLLSGIYFGSELHLGYSPTYPISYISLVNLNERKGNLVGLTWGKESSVAYYSIYHDAIYSVSKITKTVSCLKKLCQTKRYENLSCSNDGKVLIGERVDLQQEKDKNGNYTGVILEKFSIYSINLSTLEEKKIEL